MMMSLGCQYGYHRENRWLPDGGLMLYLGHFSFEATERIARRRSRARHGYFTCVAEAGDVDTALARFQRFILKLDKSEFFEDAESVYLEACVEIRSVPRDGF